MRTIVALLLLFALAGCYGPEVDSVMRPPPFVPRPDPIPDKTPTFPPSLPETVRAEVAPPPLSGGTIALSPDKSAIAVADPDRDQLTLVRVPSGAVRWSFQFAAGEQPGRIAFDNSGQIHVVLRGAGAIDTIDAATGEHKDRRAVCLEPRGIAYDAADDRLIVACAEGRLVAMRAASGGEVIWSNATEDDLRDVVVETNGIWASRFRAAETLVFDSAGMMADRIHAISRSSEVTQSAVAWRLFSDRPGALLMLHQVEQPTEANTGAGGYGGALTSDPCAHRIVQAAISDIHNAELLLLPDAVVAVDLARSSQGIMAIAAPGSAYTPGLSSLNLISGVAASDHPECPTVSKLAVPGLAPVVSVAFGADDTLYAQTREPAQLLVYTYDAGRFTLSTKIALSSVSREDSGHTIFHTNAGARIACASCHPEGRDDGLVWQFSNGPRRTPSLLGTTLGTAPYHWDGAEASFGELLIDVYSGRMSGSMLSSEQTTAIGFWVTHLPAPPKYIAPEADPLAIARGEALFNGAAQCSTCHSGPMLSNNGSFNIRNGIFQVPSLVGLRTHAPYLHDGCAATIEQRFTLCDAGAHGNTGRLEAGEINDLVSFLQTL